MRRRPLLALPAVLAALPHAVRAQSRTLRIAAPWDITSLDPSRAGFVFTRLEVAETLLGSDDGGRPVPGLATTFSVAEDRLAWRFTLRPGARFHNDTPVTAPAVVAALRRARRLPGVLGNAPIAAITAEGDAVVVIRTEKPFVALPAFLAHASTQILAPASFDAADNAVAVIGSGPYRVALAELPLKLITQRVGATPPGGIASVEYTAAPRGETRALLAESGQADLVFSPDPASLARLRTRPALAVTTTPIPRSYLVKLNAAHPFLADAGARKAISLAIDRAGIARAVLRNAGLAATQLFPPMLAEWHVPGLPPLRQDVAQASALLAALGWAPGADGILARGGERFRLELRTFPDRPELPVMAAALQDQWRQVGIAVAVAIGNSSEIPGGHRDGTLQMGLLARNSSLVPDPLGTMLQDFGTGADGTQGGDWGAMGWHSPAMQAALSALAETTDAAARAKLRGEVAGILQADLPVLPIAWFEHSLAANRRVAGVSLDPLELSYRVSAMRWA